MRADQSGPEAGLRENEYPLLYETATSDFITEFYTPSLKAASEYKRAVGYFTSSWFEMAAEGLAAFANHGGRAKWVISPMLSENDWDAITRGDSGKRNDIMYQKLGALVADLETDLQRDTTNTIAWLIADGILEIKIALAEEILSGDFHDKYGIFIDENGDKVAFHGSQNDSRKSLTNYEANSVFTTWQSDTDKKRVQQHEQRFDDLWNDRKPGVTAFALPDAVASDIVELRTDERPYDEPPEELRMSSSHRWRHQEAAKDAFLEAETGILEMATGTGKTRTSLKILDSLLREAQLDSLIVATKGNDLLDQWNETLLGNFSADEMFLYRQYGGHEDLNKFLLTQSDRLDIMLLSYSNLAVMMESAGEEEIGDSLLICDEVHNIGAPQKREALDGHLSAFRYRLGLSATPFDPYDEPRNEFIVDNIGPAVYEFGLKEAIQRGILAEMNYTALNYELSADDQAKLKEAFQKFAGLKRQNPSTPQSQLYIMLARVRKESEQKLPVFADHLQQNPGLLDSCLIFVETKDFGRKVQEIIFRHTDQFHTYYGEDDESELEAFANGSVSTLVTSRAIAEGIDIQSVENIVLFTAPRSRGPNIQRIGRALRKDPTNPGKEANILDFVVGSEVEQDLSEETDKEMTPPDRERYDWLTELSAVTQIE